MTDETGTVVGLIEDAAGGVKAPWVSLLVGIFTDALPAVLEGFGGADTPVMIAEFAVKELLGIASAAIDDLVTEKPLADVKKSVDDAVGDLLEEIKFGPKPSTATSP